MANLAVPKVHQLRALFFGVVMSLVFRGIFMAVCERGPRRVMTPMFVVIVALGATDLMFALELIPAIDGLTREAYVMLTADVFALMGMRRLYFLLGGLLDRLVYLSRGLPWSCSSSG